MKLILAIPLGLIMLPVVLLGGLGSSGQTVSPLQAPTPELISAVLSNPSIRLRPPAAEDVRSGRVDARVLAVLLIASERHTLGVGPLLTGHSYYVAGTDRVSNHVYGRAVDITMVDDSNVSPGNEAALNLVLTLASLPEPLRPDELGSPWKLEVEGVRSFTRGHGDHIHWGADR